jgi:hypothetical protein
MQPHFRVLHDTNVHTVPNSLTSKIIQRGYLASVQGHIILLTAFTVRDATFPTQSTAETGRCSNIVECRSMAHMQHLPHISFRLH